MGIYADSVVFLGTPPDPDTVCIEIEKICGLPASFQPDELDEELAEISGKLQFPGFERSAVSLKLYRPGAVARHCDEDDFPMPEIVDGFADHENRRTVYLRGYVGQEMTLFQLTLLALEHLGGEVSGAGFLRDEDRDSLLQPLTHSELRRRHLKTHIPTGIAGIFMWIIFFPRCSSWFHFGASFWL